MKEPDFKEIQEKLDATTFSSSFGPIGPTGHPGTPGIVDKKKAKTTVTVASHGVFVGRYAPFNPVPSCMDRLKAREVHKSFCPVKCEMGIIFYSDPMKLGSSDRIRMERDLYMILPCLESQTEYTAAYYNGPVLSNIKDGWNIAYLKKGNWPHGNYEVDIQGMEDVMETLKEAELFFADAMKDTRGINQRLLVSRLMKMVGQTLMNLSIK